jgi:hypothetical protein
MDRVNEAPPPRVAAELAILQAALDVAIPAKNLDRNLLIATWRWQMFDRVTEKWIADAGDGPARDLRAVRCLAEILRRFDIIAIQGLMGNARGLQTVLDALGDHWALMVTGLSRESSYNDRSAFVFDTRKVLPRGLAGQVVLAEPEAKQPSGSRLLSRQFFRPPLFAGFRCLDDHFTLANIHLVWGSAGERVAEMRAFAGWLREISEKGYYWERNLIALGQLQLLHARGPVYDALQSVGLRVPHDLLGVPTFVTSQGKPATMASAIAWFGEESGPGALGLEYVRGGVFNFLAADLPFSNVDYERYLTNHLPVWAEFRVRRRPGHERRVTS